MNIFLIFLNPEAVELLRKQEGRTTKKKGKADVSGVSPSSERMTRG